MNFGKFRFEIRAISDAQTLPRLIGYFAQRGLIPSLVQAEVHKATIVVVIEQPSIRQIHAYSIVEKMRSSILVEDVFIKYLGS